MNIGIIGLGLIGGSLGRAIIDKTSYTVYGYDINPETLKKAHLLKAVNKNLSDDNFNCLDVLIVALNPQMALEAIKQHSSKLKDGAIVMDIAGTKRMLVNGMNELAARFPKLNFISAHPMAGKEFSGIKYSSPRLFEQASMLLVPVHSTITATAKLKEFCSSLGFGNTLITSAEKHDALIAYTSQLPHIISSSYINSPNANEHNGFSAGSFKDLSRVAKMNSAMWAELLCENRDNVLPVLEHFISNLNSVAECLKNNNQQKLNDLLESGNQIKESVNKIKK